MNKGIVVALLFASVCIALIWFGGERTVTDSRVVGDQSDTDEAAVAETQFLPLSRSGTVGVTLPAGWSAAADPEWQWEHEIYDEAGDLVMVTHAPIREIGYEPSVTVATWTVDTAVGPVAATLRQPSFETASESYRFDGVNAQAEITSGTLLYTWRDPDGPYDESIEFSVLARNAGETIGFASSTARYETYTELQSDQATLDAIVKTLEQDSSAVND